MSESLMQAEAKQRVTPEEYLAIERAAEFRSEYYGGEMFAMAGASRRHVVICGNIFASLHSQLRTSSCRAYSNDLRVRVERTAYYMYPDIVVACGDAQFDDAELDTLTNPVLIIEVLSGSTEAFDRGKKFEMYRTIDSLSEYILVSQDRMLVEHYVRQDDGAWLLTIASQGDEVISLPSCHCSLRVADIYENVDQ